MNDTDVALLQRNLLFKPIDTETLRQSLNRWKWRLCSYDSGQLVKGQGSSCDELCVLLGGTVSADFLTYDGRSMRVETISAPETLASAFLFSPSRRYPVEVRASTPVRIFELTRPALIGLCSENPAVMEQLLSDIGKRTSFLAQKLRMVQFETLKQRIAHYLLHELNYEDKNTVHLMVSKKELSEIMGVARQSLFRTLSELQEKKIIEIKGRSVTVLHRGALLRMAELRDFTGED